MPQVNQDELVWAFILGACYAASDGTPKHTRSELLEMFLDLVPADGIKALHHMKETLEASRGTDSEPISRWLKKRGVDLHKGRTVFTCLEVSMRAEKALERLRLLQSVIDLNSPSGSLYDQIDVIEEYLNEAKKTVDAAKQIRSSTQGGSNGVGRDSTG